MIKFFFEVNYFCSYVIKCLTDILNIKISNECSFGICVMRNTYIMQYKILILIKTFPLI